MTNSNKTQKSRLMKFTLIFSAIFAFVFLSLAEENEAVEQAQERVLHFAEVDKEPEFPGGMIGLMRFINKNLRHPVIVGDQPQGRVVVQFTIEVDGSITDIQVIRSLDPRHLDKAAMQLVKSMPNWTPGVHNGKRVPVRFTLPIHFRLH